MKNVFFLILKGFAKTCKKVGHSFAKKWPKMTDNDPNCL